MTKSTSEETIMLFFYVRHGDPIYHPDSLTPLGHEQAHALAKRFVTYGLDKVYTSSSWRAMLTAKPTCDLLKIKPTVCEWAHESLASKDFFIKENGDRGWVFELPRFIEQLNSPEVQSLGKEWYKHPCFKGRRFEAGVKRIDAEADKFFLELGFEHDRENNCYRKVKEAPQRVALFAHQGFGAAFMSSILDIPYPLYAARFDISHSCMNVIEFDERTEKIYPRVLQVSNDSHLYKEGLMNGYFGRIKF